MREKALEIKRKELCYNNFLDAISYRLNQLDESINQKYFPNELKEEYKAKIDFLLKIRDTFF